jgi:hypothetical protein
MEDGGRLAPMAAELLIAWLFWWLFVASPAWVLLTLAPCALTVMSVCNISFVDLLMFLFGVFWGICDVHSCNVFLLLFMTLWIPTSATLFRRAVLTLWHAFLFLGLSFFFPSFLLFAWWPPLLFLVRNYYNYETEKNKKIPVPVVVYRRYSYRTIPLATRHRVGGLLCFFL